MMAPRLGLLAVRRALLPPAAREAEYALILAPLRCVSHGWDAAECLAELWASFTSEDPRKSTARKVRDALTCCARSAGDAEDMQALLPAVIGALTRQVVLRGDAPTDDGGEEALAPGTTILLPSEKLSKRDQQIIDGIKGVNEPRVYPCRGGETLEDIINPRKISKSEVERLNPKLGALKAGTKVLLPPGKYTVREKEMLQGCGILPVETLNPLALLGSPLARNALGAMIGVGAYAMYFAACRRYQDHGTKLWGNDRVEINDD